MYILSNNMVHGFDLQMVFLEEYLRASGEDVTNSSLECLYKEANTYALASHFLWGLWSILQNEMSNIEFGFLVSVA